MFIPLDLQYPMQIQNFFLVFSNPYYSFALLLYYIVFFQKFRIYANKYLLINFTIKGNNLLLLLDNLQIDILLILISTCLPLILMCIRNPYMRLCHKLSLKCIHISIVHRSLGTYLECTSMGGKIQFSKHITKKIWAVMRILSSIPTMSIEN